MTQAFRLPWMHRVVCGMALAGIIGLSGCAGENIGGKKRARTTAAGKVTFDGNPLPTGSILFTHTESGNMSTGIIIDGAYSCSSNEGPYVGENTISITGFEKDGEKPLWGGAWTKKVTIESKGFKEDFAIAKTDVKPDTWPEGVPRIEN